MTPDEATILYEAIVAWTMLLFAALAAAIDVAVAVRFLRDWRGAESASGMWFVGSVFAVGATAVPDENWLGAPVRLLGPAVVVVDLAGTAVQILWQITVGRRRGPDGPAAPGEPAP